MKKLFCSLPARHKSSAYEWILVDRRLWDKKTHMKVGSQVTIFNYELRRLRKEMGLTQEELARATGLSVGFVRAVEMLEAPGEEVDLVRNGLYRIADILNADFDLLFPADYLLALQRKVLPKVRNLVFARDIDIASLPAAQMAQISDRIESIVDARHLAEDIDHVMNLLPERERRALELHFGFHDGRTWWLDQIAKELNLTPERVRQIVDTALTRIRILEGKTRLDPYRGQDYS